MPSPFVRSTAKKAAKYIPDGQLIVDVAKGVEDKTLMTMSEIIEDELARAKRTARVVALSGPTHAEEVARDMPTLIVAASEDEAAAKAVQKAFTAPSFRVYTNTDRRGVELGGAPVLLADELAAEPEDAAAVDAALASVTDSEPVYVMYTSGSTGEPKGVTIPHRGVLLFARWAEETFGWTPETVIANQAPLYFDVSVMDVYGAMRCGGKLILTPEVLFRFPVKLPEFLRENGVTSIYWVPTVMINIANSGVLETVELPELRSVAFAGEVMPNLQLNVWRRALPGRIFANLYGPTETDVCTAYVVDREFADSEPLPIGRPLPNMRVLLLGEDGRPVPPGETGEICVAGSGVNIGYWNQPELTERAFYVNPEGLPYAPRYYRTGDLGWYNERGELMFAGRRDGQIKLRGNRIELGEIENAARMVEGTENVCALFDAAKQEIVLFVETKGTLPPRQYNRELRKYIPAYMLPQRMVTMEKLPHNANDKIDRTALKKLLA